MYIVDQHTAHERVLFEETVRRLDKHQMVGQHLLLPVQVELDPEQFAVFTEASPLLNDSGFGVAEFGGRTVRIESVPMILSRKSPEKILRKVIDGHLLAQTDRIRSEKGNGAIDSLPGCGDGG